jgi:hypothetical protein
MALGGRRWVVDQCPLSGVKQTSQVDRAVSANDPTATLAKVLIAARQGAATSIRHCHEPCGGGSIEKAFLPSTQDLQVTVEVAIVDPPPTEAVAETDV